MKRNSRGQKFPGGRTPYDTPIRCEEKAYQVQLQKPIQRATVRGSKRSRKRYNKSI